MKAPQFLKNDNISLHIGLIVITAVVVWGLTCGLWSLSGEAETNFAGMAKTMVSGGNFIPGAVESAEHQAPLALWLTAGALKISGEVNSLALRLISVVFALITLWCTYLCGRRLLGPRAGLYSAFILATMPTFMLAAAKVGPDMIFTGLITLSITAVVTHPPCERVSIIRAVVIWLCLIAAFLTYGPLAVIMVLLFIVLYAIAKGKEAAHEFRTLRFFSGILAGIVVVAVWLFLEYHFTGGTFVKQEFLELKTLLTSGIDLKGWWYYFAQAGWILGLWGIGLIVAVVMLLTHKAKFIPKWYVWLFWFAPGFIILCVVHVKNTDFALPLLPPLALFIGYYLSALAADKVMNGPVSGPIAVIVGKIFMILGIVLCTACLVVFIQLEFAWRHAFYVSQQGLVVAFIIGLLLIFLGSWRYKTQCGVLIGAIIFVLLLGNIGLNAVVLPALDVTRTPRYFNQNLQNMYPELTDFGLGAVRAENGPNTGAAGLHVYGDYKILPLAFSPDMFANEGTAALPDFILMAQADFDNLAVKPQLGGFAPVFWDTVDRRLDLVLLQRQTDVITDPRSPMPLIYTVPKPLLLASSPEAYIPATIEEAETQKHSPEEDEAVLKEIYSGDAAKEPGAAVDADTNQPPEQEIQAVETPSDTGADTTTDTSAEPTAGMDSAQSGAQPAVETTRDQDVPVNEPITENVSQPESTATMPEMNPAPAETTPEENAVNASVVEVTEEASPLMPENVDINEEAAPETNAAPSTDVQTDITDIPESNGSAGNADLPAARPSATENADTQSTPANDVEDNSAVNEPQARRWSLSLVGTAHAETMPPFAVTENNTAETEAVTGDSAPASNDQPDTPAIVPTLATEPGPVQSQSPAVNLNGGKCVLPQGLMLVNGTLIPYKSNCGGRNTALLDVNTYQPNVVRFFSINLQNGFKDNAYALHWFKTRAGKFAAEYNMLVINNLPATLETQPPYTASFNRWAMAQLKDAVQPRAVFFTGHDPAAAESITALSQTGTVASDIAGKIQIDFGLIHTTLLLEYDNTPPQVIELTK